MKRREAVNGNKGFFSSYLADVKHFEKLQLKSDNVSFAEYSTCSHTPLGGPALCTASVKNGKLFRWRVLQDTPENRKLILGQN